MGRRIGDEMGNKGTQGAGDIVVLWPSLAGP